MDVLYRGAIRGNFTLSGLSNRPRRVVPAATKRNTRVQYRHRKHCQENHRPLQYHKRYLVVSNRPIKTLLQFCNTVYRTDEDERNSCAERILEPRKLLRVPQLGEAHIPVALTRLTQAEYEFRPHSHKDEERDDLKHNTSNHNGLSCIALIFIICCGCEPAAGALEDERDKVVCHEGDCVGARAEPGDFLAVDDDYAGKAEIEGTGEEGGADC